MVQRVMNADDFNWILDNYFGRQVIRIPVTQTVSNISGQETLTDGTPEEIKAHFFKTGQRWDYQKEGFLEKGDAVLLSKISDSVVMNHKIYANGFNQDLLTIDGNASSITITTTTDTNLSTDDDIIISGTTNYDGVYTIASNASSSTLIDNIQAYWKFDETSGTTLTDSVAGNWTGTLTGTFNTGWVSGIINNALTFEGAGSNSYVALPAGSIVPIGENPLSVSVWIKPTFNIGTEEAQIINIKQTTQYMIYFDDASKLVIGFRGSNIASKYTMTPYYDNNIKNKWTHIVAVYTGGTKTNTNSHQLYINGNLYTDGKAIGSVGGTSDENIIGALFTHSDHEYKGIMDEAGIWDRVLTTTEITELYNAGTGKSYPFESLPTLTITDTNHDYAEETSGTIIKNYEKFRVKEFYNIPGVFSSTTARTEIIYTYSNLFLIDD